MPTDDTAALELGDCLCFAVYAGGHAFNRIDKPLPVKCSEDERQVRMYPTMAGRALRSRALRKGAEAMPGAFLPAGGLDGAEAERLARDLAILRDRKLQKL